MRFHEVSRGCILAALLAPPLSGPVYAQVTGKVIGVVSDADTGVPLIGAQAMVDGTNLGNVTNEDGYYFINNVPVGVQAVTARYLGYRTMTREERVLAGHTMTVDFTLPSEVVEAERIVAVIEREPLVARDNTISKSRFTADDARGLPVEDLDDVITLGAGIYAYRGGTNIAPGLVIRGGRTTESATYVDGVLINDFTDKQPNSEIGRFAVEEVDVITGGFNAEFGNAQSGIVNIVTRAGGREFHGNVRYTTDGRWGTDGYTLDELGLSFDSSTGLWTRTGSPEEEKCCGFNAIQTSIGGPIVPGTLTFFGSLEAEGTADFGPASGGWNPADGRFNSSGSTKTILPGNRGDRTRAHGKVAAFPAPAARVTGTWLYSRDQFERAQPGLLGLFQQLSPSAVRISTHDLILGWDQQLVQTAARSVNLQLRANWHQRKVFTGTPVNEISAAFLARDDNFMANCGRFCSEVTDAAGDAFEDDFLNYRFGSVDFFFESADPAQPELRSIPRLGGVDPDPVFGVPRVFLHTGLSPAFRAVDERRYGLRLDLDAQLDRVHRVKVGTEFGWINLHSRSSFFTSGNLADLYDVDPRVLAVYAQDRLDYGDLVIDLGLRLDRFDPNARFPLFPGVVPCEISAFDQCSEGPLAQLVEAEPKTEIAPRLGVAHPITDATQVRLSYGKFYQLPELRRFYDAFRTDQNANPNPNTAYGNPNLDYIETTALEVGVTHFMSDNLVLDVVGYNRDRRGALRADVFQSGTLDPAIAERRILVNGDNGNVKGLDVTLSKRYSSYFSTDLAWSLQWARGTTSSPFEFVGSIGHLFDPLFPGRLLPPPTELQVETFDRLHTINWQFSLRFPEDFRAGTTTGAIFDDFGVYLVYNAHSGEPFTRRSVSSGGLSVPLERINASRLPWFHQGDVRVTKAFALSSGSQLELFASVINFLDVKNTVFVNPGSGMPDRSGLEDPLSTTPRIPTNFRLDGSGPFDFPVALTDLDEDFRDEFSQQDLDGDGTITIDEAQTALREAIRASGVGGIGNGDSVANYGEPRQYRFGVEIRF